MQPVTDPLQFLAQGDGIIQDWDAYEQLWLDAMHVLRVYDTNKHTTAVAASTSSASVLGEGRGSTSLTGTASSPGGGINKETLTATDMSRVTHPVFVVDPGCTFSVRDDWNASEEQQQPEPPRSSTKANQQLLQLTEIMMEHWNVGAMFVAPAPMVAAFSVGRPTALIVDLGASGARVTPVVDGLLLRTAQRRSGRGGDWLDHCAWHALTRNGRMILRPRYQVGQQQQQQSSSSWSDTANLGLFHRWAMQDLMYEMRSSEAQCPAYHEPTIGSSDTDARVPFLYKKKPEKDEHSQDDNDMSGENEDEEDEDDDNDDDDRMDMDISSPTAAAARHYELPDGTLVDLSGTRVGRDLTRVPELWFTDDLPFHDDAAAAANSSILQQHYSLSNLPLHKLIHSSLSAVADVDVRKDLAANIVLVGGCSVTPGLEQRLVMELQALLPSAYKPKLVASKFAIERQCASWIGASVLSSLGSFQQLWLSRTEYDEYGAALALQRFP